MSIPTPTIGAAVFPEFEISDWKPIDEAPMDGSIVVTAKATENGLPMIWYPLRSRYVDGMWCCDYGTIDKPDWKPFEPQPSHFLPATFSQWMDELNEEVIQGEYGYEPGEFEAFPEHWRPLFEEGLTPLQAFKRALSAHDEERKQRDADQKANWQRIQTAEDPHKAPKDNQP